MASDTGKVTLQTLLDRALIEDALARYARAVDRGDWEAVRAAYHSDAYDDHGDFKGDIDGLVLWLKDRFKDSNNGMHFLGNCLIEFASPQLALAETYFISHRLRPPTVEERDVAGRDDAMCRQGWGRYIDRFECRGGDWRIARRTVVMDTAFTYAAQGGVRQGVAIWGERSDLDFFYGYREELFSGAM